VADRNFFERVDDFRENGFVMREMMSPKIRLCPETSARAWVIG
jgi:hypothetical protein